MGITAIFDSIQSAHVQRGVDDFELYRKMVFVPSGSDEPAVGLSVLDVWPATDAPENTLLLLHGFAANGSWWRPQLPMLAQRNRVIVIDMRGNGRSQHTQSGYSTEQFAIDAHAVLKALGVTDRVIVAGHSTGGFVAVDYALLFAYDVKRLILVATPLEFASISSTVRTARLFMGLPDFVYRIGQPFYELDPRGQASLLGLKRLFRDSLLSWNGRDKFPNIQVPTLVIEGQRDALFSAASYQEVTNLIPRVERVNISISKHQVTLERPEAVLRAMLRFIEGPQMEFKPLWRSVYDDRNRVDLLRNRPWAVNYTGEVKPELFIPKVPLTRLLAYSRRQFGDRPALRCGKQRLTYSQFAAESELFAAWLHSLGVRPGTHVLLLLPNSLHFPIAFFGCLRLGATAVLTHLHNDVQELVALAQRTEAFVLVTTGMMSEQALAIVAASQVQHIIFASEGDYSRPVIRGRLHKQSSENLQTYLHQVRRDDGLGWLSGILSVTSDHLPSEPGLDETAVVLYTGNNQSDVKLTQRNLLSGTVQVGKWLHNVRPGKARVLCSVPLYTAYGLTYGLNLAVYRGAQLILLPDHTAESLFEQIPQTKPDMVVCSATVIHAVYQQPGKHYTWPRKRPLFISSEALLPMDVKEGFRRITRSELLEVYGLSATAQVALANLFGQSQSGSIGVPLPNTEACIVDPQSGEALNANQAGELWLRGPQVGGLVDDSSDGWLHTGDMMIMDSHGFFHFMGRLTDIWLAPEGERVFVRDVIEVIYEMAEVAETAVSHTAAGLVAYIHLLPGKVLTETAVVDFCRKRLPVSHIPHDICFVGPFPRDSTGKLQREQLFKL